MDASVRVARAARQVQRGRVGGHIPRRHIVDVAQRRRVAGGDGDEEQVKEGGVPEVKSSQVKSREGEAEEQVQ